MSFVDQPTAPFEVTMTFESKEEQQQVDLLLKKLRGNKHVQRLDEFLGQLEREMPGYREAFRTYIYPMEGYRGTCRTCKERTQYLFVYARTDRRELALDVCPCGHDLEELRRRYHEQDGDGVAQ